MPVENRSLVPVEHSPQFDIEHYLVTDQLLSPDKLPQQISLVNFSIIMQRLYGWDAKEYLQKGSFGQRLEQVLKDQKSRFPILSKARKTFEETYETQQPLERETFIWADDVVHAVTAIGEHHKVALPKEDRYGVGIIDIHTHPKDMLFSLPDFYCLLPEENYPRGNVNAIIILCPNIQILALATNETPTKADLGIDPADLRWPKELKNRFDTLNEDYLKATAENKIKTLEEIVNKLRTVMKEAHMFEIREGLSLARLMVTKLYSSTNCEDFYEFSS